MILTATLKITRPPGPKSRPIVGHAPQLRKNPFRFLVECAREYGDIVYLRFGPNPVYLLCHPNHVEEVLNTKSGHFIKGRSLRSNQMLLGEGLLTSEGDFWKRQRHLAQPAFHRKQIATYGQIMVDYTNQKLATWQTGEVREIQQEMVELTLSIVAKTLFDADIVSEAKEVGMAMQAVMKHFNQRAMSALVFPPHVPTIGNLSYRRAIQRLDAIIDGFISQRRVSSENPGDLLSLLLEAQGEDSNDRMSDQQLRDEVMTLFVAGHETTAHALAWIWLLLSQHSHVEAKLHAEIERVLNGRAPVIADLPQLHYTSMVIQESLRLYPPVWRMARQAITDCEIGGYPIKAGTTIFISQWLIHRDARFYDRPNDFIPERWENNFAEQLPNGAYFPFGIGKRTCIGNRFAQMEIALILATIAQKFRMSLVPGHPIEIPPAVILHSKQGMKMQIRPR